MSPYVLVIIMAMGPGPSWASHAIALDMPGIEDCKSALNNWRNLWKRGAPGGQVTPTINLSNTDGFCASRDGKELVK